MRATLTDLVILLGFPRTNLSSLSPGLLPDPALSYLPDPRWLLHSHCRLPVVTSLLLRSALAVNARLFLLPQFLLLCFSNDLKEIQSSIIYFYIPICLGYILPILTPLFSKGRKWLFTCRRYGGNSHHSVLSYQIII